MSFLGFEDDVYYEFDDDHYDFIEEYYNDYVECGCSCCIGTCDCLDGLES